MNSLMCEDIILSVMIALSQGYPSSQFDVLCLLEIIRTIGSCMEHDTENKLTIDEIFRTLHTWQMEKLLPTEIIEKIRDLRDLKDAKWVITMEVSQTESAVPGGDWEKSFAGRKMRNRREKDEEQAELIRAANEFSTYCENLWNDYVRYFVVDDIADEVLKFDDAQRSSFIGYSFKSLSSHSEVQQRRVSMLLQTMLSRGDISREGVQRDLLPLIEGTTVSTKYGMVKTDHILFICSGAFHLAKPSDMLPELQGRLPIRVELKALTHNDFVRILTEPEANLIEQYIALLGTENFHLHFAPDAIDKIADIAVAINENVENIGARRLHTVLEILLEDISFSASDKSGEEITITAQMVEDKLSKYTIQSDLSKFIL